MEYPFEPKALWHKHGGRILRITGIGHEVARASEGMSRDTWHFLGDVKWDDGSESKGIEIAPYSLCYVEQAQPALGKLEVGSLLNAMNTYLALKGTWCDSKSKHEGWYANERKVSRRA